MKYNTIILDDEQLAIDILKNYVERLTQLNLVATFQNSLEAFQYIQNNPVDLVILDIAMPEMSGIEFVKSNYKKTKFIYVSSYSEYAIESFELGVVDYLLKTASFERFTKSIHHFESSLLLKEEVPSFYIKDSDEYIKINVNDIIAIEGMKDYVKIHTKPKVYIVHKTMKSIEQLLDKYQFMRIHKSYIIPLKKVSSFNGDDVTVQNLKFPVGHSYKKTLKTYFEASIYNL